MLFPRVKWDLRTGAQMSSWFINRQINSRVNVVSTDVSECVQTLINSNLLKADEDINNNDNNNKKKCGGETNLPLSDSLS